VVHVLSEIHRSLTDTGVLLDIHPLTRHPTVAVRTRDDIVVIGSPDDSVGIEMIRAARGSRNRVVREGLFLVDARRWFDLPVYYPSVDAWLARRRDRCSTSIVSDALLVKARQAMRAAGSTLVVTERVGATRLAPSR
jgi:hypothetical protein